MITISKKIRFFWRFFSSFIKKHRRVFLSSLLLGFLSFLLIPHLFRLMTAKDLKTIGVNGRYTLAELPLEIQNLIGAGLTKYTADGNIEADLAESWTINQDGREYVFKLKDNLVWQDGKQVLAKDIDYHFSDVKTTTPDNKTIIFELKEPFSPFPSILAKPILKRGVIGTGEYRIKKVQRDQAAISRLFLFPENKKNLKLTFRFYPTEESLRTAFKLGEISQIQEITDPKEFKNWNNTTISPFIKYNRFIGLFFNSNDPGLENKSTRQALAYAIRKQWQPRALGPISPASWAFNPSLKPYDFDFDNARKLLKSEEGVEPLKEIELTTIPSLLNIAEEIKKDWENLGISCQVKTVNSLGESFQALLIAQEIPMDPDQYIFWHSTQGLNLSGYKSPKIDKLLEEGRKTMDLEQRKVIYQDFQKFLVEDTPVVFLFHPTVYSVTRN